MDEWFDEEGNKEKIESPPFVCLLRIMSWLEGNIYMLEIFSSSVLLFVPTTF